MKKRRLLNSFVIFLAVSIYFLSPIQIKAQDETGSTLSISPAILDVKIEPGKKVSRTIIVTNRENVPVGVKIYQQNFEAADIYGAMKFSFDDNTIYSAKSWFKPETATLLLKSKETKKYQFTISVPKDAELGGHYAVMFFEPINSPTAEGNSIGVNSRIGALFFLTVGNAEEKGSVLGATAGGCSGVSCSFKTAKFRQWGPVPFEFKFENTGNIHMKVGGKIEIYNLTGQKIGEVPVEQKTVLPKTTRLFKATWLREPLFGHYSAKLTVDYGTKNQKQTAQTGFWAIPYKIIIPVLILAIFIAFLVIRKKRNKHKLNNNGLHF